MGCTILIASDNKDFITQCQNLSSLKFYCTSSTTQALDKLSEPNEYGVVLADRGLNHFEINQFFSQMAEKKTVVPLLAASKENIPSALEEVNQHNIFRLLALPCSDETLNNVFSDAVQQYRLIRRERELRERIQQLASIDSLTGCHTRAVLLQRLPLELRRSIRYNHYLSIILCDVDRLGKINEKHGHMIGDRILTGVAQAAYEIFRDDVDWITRWGNDEFIIVLPETPIRGAGIVAQRLQQAVNELVIEGKDSTTRASITLSVTGYSPETIDRNNTVESLLLVADNCLKQAQSNGGNSILICP